MKADVEIAQKAKLQPIEKIAKKAGIPSKYLEFYGKYKAKVFLDVPTRKGKKGRLIFVTAITPTAAGEGKTVTSIGITQALGRLRKKVMLCLREPSLGPVFGVKGGATGGGYSQVAPMIDIDLHFTGDIHAVGTAHNLLAAVLDNHLANGNKLGIDISRITWKRVVDMNDRALRSVIIGRGGPKVGGVKRESSFDITTASEVMAILALAKDMKDLRERLSRIIVGYTKDSKPVTAKDLKAVGAMTLLLKDAIRPNLVQTLEGNPAFVHCGPFANIAHGNSSIIATKLALGLADYVVTEGGFAADLGGEKFFDIVCRTTGIKPDIVVLVVSIKALKLHGGVPKEQLKEENLEAVKSGIPNMEKHIENLKKFGIPIVVAVNRFPTDTQKEIDFVKSHCKVLGVPAEISEVVVKGGAGGIALAKTVLETLKTQKANFRYLYDLELPIKEKIEKIAKEIYGADGVKYTEKAEADINTLTELGFSSLPLCMAKTQMSLSDNPDLKGAPKGWLLTVREVRPSIGAGFLVPVTGEIRTMPGLPEHPAAENIDIDEKGHITGLF